ncbi:MAG: hypothetical protein HRT88_19645 [Lentisphaeraceae bacterium]|nr:hypothetical protein [Lentisphaeraceae bacterium]
MSGAYNIDFGAIGRTNIDLYADEVEFEIKDKEIILHLEDGTVSIFVDETPSEEVDKVTSLTRLDKIVPLLVYEGAIAGGVSNSITELQKHRSENPNLHLRMLNPMNPELSLGDEHFNIIKSFEAYDTMTHCLNKLPLCFNLILRNGRNKLIVRNKTDVSPQYSLDSLDRSLIKEFVNINDALLLNAPNHPALTDLILSEVYKYNQKYLRDLRCNVKKEEPHVLVNETDFAPGLSYKKVTTVITSSKALDKDFIASRVLPFTSSIFNLEDLFSLFSRKSTVELGKIDLSNKEDDGIDARYSEALIVLSRIRHGMLTRQGTLSRVLDPFHNVYVTDGQNGHLVCHASKKNKGQFEVSLYGLNNSDLSTFGEFISALRYSTNGFGDSFAAGVALAEAMRNSDPQDVAATANSFVATRAGYHKSYDREDIVLHARWKLVPDGAAERIM